VIVLLGFDQIVYFD